MGIEGENPGLGSSKTLNLGEGFCMKKKEGNARISLALLRNSEMFGNLVKVMQNSSVKKKRKSNG